MIANVVNAIAILAGGGIGLFFGKKIPEKFNQMIYTGLQICVGIMGIQNALVTEDPLVLIICIAVGVLIGECIGIQKHLGHFSAMLEKKVASNGQSGAFASGFLNATLVFCVGSMAIMGSMEAGMTGEYGIILSKSAIDGVAAIGFAASMGIGVLFASGSVLIYQGILTLLAGIVAPFLPVEVILEMKAVGGVLLVVMAVDQTVKTKTPIRLANMLPAMFLPIVYVPARNALMLLLGKG